MNRESLWAIYTRKNPSFLTSGATFTASGLKKFFDTTWDQAHTEGMENGRAWEKVNPSKTTERKTDAMRIFKEVFGENFKL